MSAAHQSSPPLTLDSRERNFAIDLSAHWRPPIRLPLSQWAEANVVLSSEYSARSGPLRLFGWQKEIFDSFTDPYTIGTVCCVGIQMVKTLFIQCAFAYVVAEDPGPILLVQPTEDDGKEFSKERITPMIRDCAVLQGKITDSIHDSKNTILGKAFPGGRLSIVSSQKAGNLARRTIRYGFFDEIDKYPHSAGKEGDPRELAKGRLANFRSRAKWIESCSPTLAGESVIWSEYDKSDQRKPWVDCPKCKFSQVLNFRKNVIFDVTLDSEKIARSAYYQCQNSDCKHHWTDAERWSACEKAVWKAGKPFQGVAGFWISHLYSPWKKISDIVAHFLRVKDKPQELKVFVNTVLAELWEEKGETPDAEVLYGRREDYPHSEEAVVPQRALLLTAAVDVQDNPPRLECEVKGWGRGKESWSVGYFVIQSSLLDEDNQVHHLPVTSQELWDELDERILQRDWLHASGNYMQIRVMAIDTGSRPKPVYEFAVKHPQISYSAAGAKVHAYRTVVPIKGNDDPLKIISGVSKEDASRKRQNVRIVSIGTICAKGQIYDNLRNIAPSLTGKPRPGCFHHPMYERGYFDQLCSEYRMVHPKTGEITYVKRVDVRNEALDCFDSETEVLTKSGWKRFAELHILDDVATVNLTGDFIEYQRPISYIAKSYVGDMVSIQGKRIDVLVTPNHRMVTYKKKQIGKDPYRKWNFDTDAKITLAKDLTIHHQLMMSAKWYGDNSCTIFIPASRRKKGGQVIHPDQVVDRADLAELLGWYLAEGHSTVTYSRTQKNWRHRISISQNEGPKLDRIKALVARLPWKWHGGTRKYKDRKICVLTCSSTQLYDFLADGGRNVYNKRVPDWLKQSSSRVISRFMEAAVLRDGWQQGNFRTVCTVSKELADGYQECFLKMGKSSNVAIRYPGPCTVSGNPNGKVVPQFNVTEIRSTRASLDGGGKGRREYLGKLVPYVGMVYCATVPNGTLIVRRNGRAFVAGNCGVYNLAAATIAGIERFTDEYWKQLESAYAPLEPDDETGVGTVGTLDPTAQTAVRLDKVLQPAVQIGKTKVNVPQTTPQPALQTPVRKVRGRF